MPSNPVIKINTNGSYLGNPGIAGAEGILRNHLGQWILGFSLHVGLATNNMVELFAVRQGLTMVWNLGFKFIYLELDSKVVINWLKNSNTSFPTNMLPLIGDCRNLLERDWEVRMQHIYHEANECADALAKRGTHQQNLLTVYSTCPSFVYVYYIRDMAGLGNNKLCAQRSTVDDV